MFGKEIRSHSYGKQKANWFHLHHAYIAIHCGLFDRVEQSSSGKQSEANASAIELRIFFERPEHLD